MLTSPASLSQVEPSPSISCTDLGCCPGKCRDLVCWRYRDVPCRERGFSAGGRRGGARHQPAAVGAAGRRPLRPVTSSGDRVGRAFSVWAPRPLHARQCNDALATPGDEKGASARRAQTCRSHRAPEGEDGYRLRPCPSHPLRFAELRGGCPLLPVTRGTCGGCRSSRRMRS